jgi:aminoglycoside phosphotransferase (APT) family kinase protein
MRTDAEGVRVALRSLLPELAEAPVRLAGSGECYEAWWVGDRHIVRFAPTDPDPGFSVEMAVLPRLAEAIETPIPRPLRLGRDPTTGGAVLVQEAVIGTPLLPEVWAGLNEAQRRSLAAEIGRFLAQLQAVPLALASVELPEARFHGKHLQPQAIEQTVFPRMPAADVAACRALAEAFEPCPPASWVFAHDDLYNHHVLIRDDASLAGVIDFGDLGRGDPNCDLGTLLDDFGLDFVADVLCDQPPDVVRRRLSRARFF